MNEHPLQRLIDAPLADACKINPPAGKRPNPRAKKPEYYGGPDGQALSPRQLRERKKKAEAAKLEALFDYHASTDLEPRRVAEHLGLYRQEQTGTDINGKPTFSRVLDVERVEEQLAWRRKAQ